MLEAPSGLTALAIKSDNKTVIAAGHFPKIWVHDLLDEDVTDEFSQERTPALEGEGHTFWIRSLIISPDEKTLLSQSRNPTQECHRLWNLQTKKLIRTFETSRDWIADSLAVRPNGQTIASGTRNGTVQVWDLYTDEVKYSLTGRSPSAMTPDGKVLVYCSDLNEIIVWDLEFNQEICTLEGHSVPIQKIALSRDREFIASHSTVKGTGEPILERTLKIWGVLP
jgi:WD40 repeat protein